ncbi:hypothetical protein FI667_g2341, partial [Globisporangium splendens]
MRISLPHSPSDSYNMQQRPPDAIAGRGSTSRCEARNATPKPLSSANAVVSEARLMKKSRLQHALTDAERLQTIDCCQGTKKTASKDNQRTSGSGSISPSSSPLSTSENALACDAIHDSVLAKMHLIMGNAANTPLLERVRLAWTHELPTSTALSTPYKRLKESDRDRGREHRELPDTIKVTLLQIWELHGPDREQQVRDRVRERDALLLFGTHTHEHERERQVLETLGEGDDGDVAGGEPECWDAPHVVHVPHEQHVERGEERDDDTREQVHVVPRVIKAAQDAVLVDQDREERDARADRRHGAVLERVEVEHNLEVVAPRGAAA